MLESRETVLWNSSMALPCVQEFIFPSQKAINIYAQHKDTRNGGSLGEDGGKGGALQGLGEVGKGEVNEGICHSINNENKVVKCQKYEQFLKL